MALLWMEGFDQYANGNLPHGMSWHNMVAPAVADSTRSARMLNVASSKWADAKVADNISTFILGFALYMNTATTARTFLYLLDDNAVAHLYLQTATGGFAVKNNGGTTLLTVAVASYEWHYIELKVTIHDSAGAIEARVDGAVVGSVSGVDTRNQPALSGVSRIRVGWQGSATYYSFHFDDFYLCDTVGSVNADYLGDCRVNVLWPDGDSTVQMSRSGGATNHVNVNAVADGDTSYVYTSTSGHKDLYTVANIDTTAVIYGVAASAVVRAGDIGLRDCRLHISSGGYALSGDRIATDTYLHAQLVSNALAGSSPWTVAAINEAAIGVEAV